ncbi:subclass B3 metallo-beta-lactamase [Solimonas terrae]|uniref:Subclass B3 metallo-beta-lactamase n=1 Tax=Solimonas terrae TaxID=1396819 RepID=A0A6M2BRR9_9GAMM|nr:subclass B3 metallo-beta-lactamase [Solimonas terrae]NGY04911.1 subclass B3 metallo-beta-lactamase [Solimonas terrae]
MTIAHVAIFRKSSSAVARALLFALLLGGGGRVLADDSCDACARWNEPVDPFRIFGNTYYVGARGISSILITSPQGHVLIDGGLPESAPLIANNIVALGFALDDVKIILNSHAHFDHAGGIAELARESGAQVMMSPWSANALRHGNGGVADPQYGSLPAYPSFSHVQTVEDGETIKLGELRLTAHFTGGHTPGGTSWTWQSCEDHRCADIVYADSLTAVSAPDFRFTAATRYPQVLKDFERSFRTIAGLDCDILLTPHPDASAFWQRREAQQDSHDPVAFVDTGACETYVEIARKQLQERLNSERAQSAAAAAPAP